MISREYWVRRLQNLIIELTLLTISTHRPEAYIEDYPLISLVYTDEFIFLLYDKKDENIISDHFSLKCMFSAH